MNTYSPSHASSSISQVANTYQGNPQALAQRTQATNGMTPELIDLLAFQKLQADKKAAANQIALSMGEQPTVAQGMKDEAMNSAREEVTKGMGLPGLMQQGQAMPQNRQQMAPPRPPQQGAPQGAGLPGAQSNLPKQYQAGGIVAFDEGGDVEKAPNTELEAEVAAANQASLEYTGFPMTAEQRARLVQRSVQRAAEEAAGRKAGASGRPFDPGSYRAPATPATPAAPVQAASSNADRGAYPGQGSSGETTPAPTRAPAPVPAPRQQGLGATAPAQAQAQRQAPTPGQGSVGRAPEGGSMRDALEKSVMEGLGADKNAAAEDAMKRYDTRIGQGNLARIAEQGKRTEGLRALQAQQRTERPSDLMVALQRMGQNVHGVGLGGAFAGVGAAVDKAKAGYQAQELKDMSEINKLLDLQDKAIQENDIAGFNMAEKALTEVAAGKKDAMTTGASLVNAQEMADARRQIAKDAAAGRASATSNSRLDREAAADAARARSEEKQAMDLAMKSADNTLKDPIQALKHKGSTAETLASEMYPRILAQLRGTAPKQAPGMDQNRASQFKVIR